MEDESLESQVLGVIKGVLIHQQPRWGVIVGQQRQLEAWWKHEMVSALQAWTWSFQRVQEYAVECEIKPKNHLPTEDGSQESVDILVAPWDADANDWNRKTGDRVWVELKERGTWWGGPNKALGAANAGLMKDLHKWGKDNAEWSDRDTVLACHLVTHEGEYPNDPTHPLPPNWEDALDQVRDSPEYTCVGSPFVVGYPCESRKMNGKWARWARWVRMDVFRLAGSDNN